MTTTTTAWKNVSKMRLTNAEEKYQKFPNFKAKHLFDQSSWKPGGGGTGAPFTSIDFAEIFEDLIMVTSFAKPGAKGWLAQANPPSYCFCL